MKKIPVAVLGATGMVGQRFVELLHTHPWFEITVVAASPRSAGRTYREAVGSRWALESVIPPRITRMKMLAVESDIDDICNKVRLAFCALDMEKDSIIRIEESYAARGVFIVSNNSAHRWTPDVPMILPEINPHHLDVIRSQRKKRGWTTGGIIVKSNCSIQSYVPVLQAVKKFRPESITVTSMQAISGAGKTFRQWPEMIDNVIPYIGGEEEKSEREPLKVWGTVVDGVIRPATAPVISATCVRVAVSNGHMASVSVRCANKTTVAGIVSAISAYKSPIAHLRLPSSPKKFITYFQENDRPQSRLDRDRENGMGISVGRVRKDTVLDFKFVALSHNTIRGAAGGAVLAAELLKAKGYL